MKKNKIKLILLLVFAFPFICAFSVKQIYKSKTISELKALSKNQDYVSEKIKEINSSGTWFNNEFCYFTNGEYALLKQNNPHKFSVVGDCNIFYSPKTGSVFVYKGHICKMSEEYLGVGKPASYKEFVARLQAHNN